MKRRVMAIVIVGALLLSVGTAALAAGDLGGGNTARPAVMRDLSTDDDVQAGAASGGVTRDAAPVLAGGKRGGSGDTVIAGGARGGVVQGTDPVLTDGRGGIFGDR